MSRRKGPNSITILFRYANELEFARVTLHVRPPYQPGEERACFMAQFQPFREQ